MSLTSFLEDNSDVRARLLSEFSKPPFRLKAPIQAAPLTNKHGLTGTAFDYLLRFYVQKINPCVRSRRWIAYVGLALLGKTKSGIRARRTYDMAQARFNTYLESRSEKPTRALAESAVALAYLDTVYRVGLLDPNAFRGVSGRILDDLKQMILLVRRADFIAKRRCTLNPTFGIGSRLVGGADGDLVLDDTLIDIKTTKHLRFERETFNQLLGYYLLSCLGNIDNCSRGPIRYLAVYYARYCVLYRIPVSDFVDERRLPSILKWFSRRAMKH